MATSGRWSHLPTGGELHLGIDGGPQPPERAPGGKVRHRLVLSVPAAPGSPWLVPTVVAGQFSAVCTGLALLALPSPSYDPGAEHTHQGLVLEARTTRGLAPVTQTAPPAAAANTAAAVAADTVEAPTTATNFWLAVGVLLAFLKIESTLQK